MRTTTLFASLLLLAVIPAPVVAESCVDPANRIGGLVSIVGERGPGVPWPANAWIYGTPNRLITALHFVKTAKLGRQWSPILIGQAAFAGEAPVYRSTMARVIAEGPGKVVKRGGSDWIHPPWADIALLELHEAVPNARALRVRPQPILAAAVVMSLAYSGKPARLLRYSFGFYREQTGEDDRRPEYRDARGLGIIDIANRSGAPLIVGTSGSPLLDCDGFVIGTVVASSSKPLVLAVPATTMNKLLIPLLR